MICEGQLTNSLFSLMDSLFICIELITFVSTICGESGQKSFQYEYVIPSSEEVTSLSPNGIECPTWFAFNNSTNQCECGDELGGVLHCDRRRGLVYVIDCYCMTYDSELGTIVGSCSTNCISQLSNTSFGSYIPLPFNTSLLNEAMCGKHWNRKGKLCGQCKEGYYRSVYSYRLDCVHCADSNQAHNWGKYVAFAFVPLTVFYILALVFRIDTSQHFPEGLVAYAQIIASPPSIRLSLAAVTVVPQPKLATFCDIIFTIYGFWSLDYLRTVVPPTCLSISNLQALTLDYAIAFYPVLLIITTCILIELHDNDCGPVVWIFRLFGNCTNIKSSIIIVFSAFLRLSYAKLLSVSFDLLVPVHAYDITGRCVGVYLYYDATIEYFGNEHLPYALLAIFVVVIFIIFPIVLLLVYPLKYCSFLRKWSSLRVCLDTYQGFYKDGTSGTADCRWFSCIYLFVRILLLSTFYFIPNSYFYALAAGIFLLMTLLHVIVKPYRESFNKYNTVHALLSLNVAVLFMTLVCIDVSSLHSLSTKTFSIILCCFILASFIIYSSGHLFHRIYLVLLRCYHIKR